MAVAPQSKWYAYLYVSIASFGTTAVNLAEIVPVVSIMFTSTMISPFWSR